mmetsp:Transcript_19093/g.72171  ORF Transcript_19093/g.72171 Transcript_19093/m.72171 type:complete len:284 (-) Transcript_19093:3450-4301(-)
MVDVRQRQERRQAKHHDESDQDPDDVVPMVIVEFGVQIVDQVAHLHDDCALAHDRAGHLRIIVPKLGRHEPLKDVVQRGGPVQHDELLGDLVHWLHEASEEIENLHEAGADGHGGRHRWEDGDQRLAEEGHDRDPEENEHVVLKEEIRLVLEPNCEVVDHREDEGSDDEVGYFDNADRTDVRGHLVHVGRPLAVEHGALLVEWADRGHVADDAKEQRRHEDQRDAAVCVGEVVVVLLPVYAAEEQRNEGPDADAGDVVLRASIVVDGRAPHAHLQLHSVACRV